jgi:hypothetical protein
MFRGLEMTLAWQVVDHVLVYLEGSLVAPFEILQLSALLF